MAGESIGWGAEFWLGDGATPSVLFQLQNVTSITPPNEQADDVETTHFKSPRKRREYIQGLIETGEGTFGMNYVPGSPTDIHCREAKTSGTRRPFKIVIPDDQGEAAWEIEGECYAKGYARDIPIDDKMGAELTVKFTGDIDEQAAA